MPVIGYKEFNPAIAKPHFIAPSAWVTGNVTLGEEVTILFGAALRGDIQPIRIGSRTNIQDNAVVHTSFGLGPCEIGDEVTIGHGAILHGCTVKNRCIIGMNSTVLDNAIIEENCIIGANSLVPMGKVIPAGSLAFGNPAKVIRPLKPTELDEIKRSFAAYVRTGAEYARVLRP